MPATVDMPPCEELWLQKFVVKRSSIARCLELSQLRTRCPYCRVFSDFNVTCKLQVITLTVREKEEALQSSAARPLVVALLVCTVMGSTEPSEVDIDVALITTVVILSSVAE